MQLVFLEKGKDWEKTKNAFPKELKKIFLPPHHDKMALSWDKICSEYMPFNQNIKREADEIATIIYTSGTTGQPKGVMHTFGSFSYAARNILEMINLKGEQHFFSLPPLAHVAERALIEVGSLYINASISFLENKTTFPENLRKTQPTIFLAVPFIYGRAFKPKFCKNLAKRNFLFYLKNSPTRSIHQKKAQKENWFLKGSICYNRSRPYK